MVLRKADHSSYLLCSKPAPEKPQSEITKEIQAIVRQVGCTIIDAILRRACLKLVLPKLHVLCPRRHSQTV